MCMHFSHCVDMVPMCGSQVDGGNRLYLLSFSSYAAERVFMCLSNLDAVLV